MGLTVAEARQVDRERAVGVGEGGDGRQEGALGSAEAVEHHDRLRVGSPARATATPLSGVVRGHLEPRRVRIAARGGEEADAGVEVVADL